jgi:hypothetical protein
MDDADLTGPPGAFEYLPVWLRSFWTRDLLAPAFASFGIGIMCWLLAAYVDDPGRVLAAWFGACLFLVVRYRQHRLLSLTWFYFGMLVAAVGSFWAIDVTAYPVSTDIGLALEGRSVALFMGFVAVPPCGLLVGLLIRRGGSRPYGLGLPSVAALAAAAALLVTLVPGLTSPVASSFEIDVPSGWTTYGPGWSGRSVALTATVAGVRPATDSGFAKAPQLDVNVTRQPESDLAVTSRDCLPVPFYPTYGVNERPWAGPAALHVQGAALATWTDQYVRGYGLGVTRDRQVGLLWQHLCYSVSIVIPKDSVAMSEEQVSAILASFQLR